jgi:uncharacterized protein
MKPSYVRPLSIVATAFVTASIADPSIQKTTAPLSAAAASILRQDLEVVDCLLPGQVRQLGTRATYVTQRRPARTTASDCRIRGGEYVALDRANPKSALAVWLPAAEAGDAEAQTNVGEIFDQGIGGNPNHEVAALWYQKAADQGYARALFNLGTLYEQGQGVSRDKLKALNLYRQAWGLPEDSLIYQSAAAEEQNALRLELQKKLDERDVQIGLLQKQLQQLQDRPAMQPIADRNVQTNTEIQTLRKWLQDLEAERRVDTQRLAGISKFRMPQVAGTAQPSHAMPVAQHRKAGEFDFGRYYALVIGNQHYRYVDSLQTPINDAQRVAKVLANKYGFTVKIVEDASDVAMLKALNDLNSTLQANDNLLIYYAGHGYRLSQDIENRKTGSGYWLPINADAPPYDTFWVPNEQVTAHLARLPAKRVLLVSDSCYAGLLSPDPSYLFANDKVGYSSDYIKFKLPKRSRLLLSSGGDRPVLDSGGGGNSVFARAFLEELEANNYVLPVPQLFARIRKRVEAIAAHNTFVQAPEFQSIKNAGHELGDFFFVPKG